MENQLQPNNQPAVPSIYVQHSQQLMQCLIKLDAAQTPSDKSFAKMELLAVTGRLMPEGKPLLLETVKYPQIASLIKQLDRKTMMKVVLIMVQDFCSSVNVVRNMNQDQMIEAAAMLIDECGNFRLEDYQIMFSMGKRGSFPAIKLMDRVDIQFISALMDEYWKIRHAAGIEAQNTVEWKQPDKTVPGEQVGELMQNFVAMMRDKVEEDTVLEYRPENKLQFKKLDEVVEMLKLPPQNTAA